MYPLRIRRRALTVLVAAVMGAVLALTSNAQATPPNFVYRGTAFGALVSVGSVVHAGPSFRAILYPCTSRPGDVATNSGASVNVSGILQTGTIDNKVSTSRGASSGYTQSTSAVQNVNVLQGLVTATAVKASSRVAYKVGSGFSFANASTVTGLNVNGTSMTLPAPNTKISISGVGYVILNQQTRTIKNGVADQTVNVIRLVVTVANNAYGLAPGTDIIVGHAHAGITTPRAGGPVRGYAFGSQANVGGTVTSGQSAFAGMACLGGTNTKIVATVSIPGIASTGSVVDTVTSSVGAFNTNAHATSTIQMVNVLQGLVKANAVQANIGGSFNGSTHTFSDTSSFTSLVVNGVAQTSVKPNTTIAISGLGTLYLHRVIRTTRTLTVRMIELVVTTSNSFGLSIGTHVQIGVTHIAFRD
jgi:hypothetical protein